MIKGIGIDLIELDRIERLMNRNEKFIERILGEEEKKRFAQFTNDNRKIEYVAGRFAAKEAYSKALGTGIGHAISFKEIEIVSNEQGRPAVYINGERKDDIFVSISHSREYAIAQIIIA